MRKRAKPLAILSLGLSLALLSFGPVAAAPMPATQAAVVGPGTVVYNLYATDGYVAMADGSAVYTYGFVGGRNGTAIDYIKSCVPGDPDPVTGKRPCTYPAPARAAGAVPVPTGGPIAPTEAQFAGNAQFPAPIIYAKTTDVVEIRLKNLGVVAKPDAPNDPHSIHLHGLDVDAANDGVPETSVGAVPANLCADGTTALPGTACDVPASGAGNVVVYMFAPTKQGTYMYHCHQEADIHVNMGMYGALIAYNPTDAGAVSGPGGQGALWGYPYDKDYVFLLSEFDVRGHQDEEGTYVPKRWDPDPYNWALYKPQYWFINGLSFPQTIHAGFQGGLTWTDWLAAHPGYDPLITGSVSAPNATWGTKGQKVLIRVINMGFETHPMHMHGFHGKVLGSDQREWNWANSEKGKSKTLWPFGQGLEKNTLLIGSGETYEWLIDFGQQTLNSTYPAGTQTRYYDPSIAACAAQVGVPTPAPNQPIGNTFTSCPVIPEAGAAGAAPYIGGPVVGPSATDANSATALLALGPANTGIQGQLFPFHNHDDYKATNDGVYPGGMFTMIMTLP